MDTNKPLSMSVQILVEESLSNRPALSVAPMDCPSFFLKTSQLWPTPETNYPSIQYQTSGLPFFYLLTRPTTRVFNTKPINYLILFANMNYFTIHESNYTIFDPV